MCHLVTMRPVCVRVCVRVVLECGVCVGGLGLVHTALSVVLCSNHVMVSQCVCVCVLGTHSPLLPHLQPSSAILTARSAMTRESLMWICGHASEALLSTPWTWGRGGGGGKGERGC